MCVRVGLSVGCVGVGMCTCAPACVIVYEVCYMNQGRVKRFTYRCLKKKTKYIVEGVDS